MMFWSVILGRHGLIPSELHTDNPRSGTTLGVVLLVHTLLVYEDMLASLCHTNVLLKLRLFQLGHIELFDEEAGSFSSSFKDFS